MVICCKREHITWRISTIFLTVIVVILIVLLITVGLVVGLRKCEQIPDLSVSIIYSNTKEAELMNIDGVRVFGMKDFTGNIQSVHAIQTFNAVYILDNDRIVQIQSTKLALIFNYNNTLGQYYVTAISENSSYEISSLYYTPTVTFPEIIFDYSVDMNMSDPFTGIIIDMKDSLSSRLISDASLQLNYYDMEYHHRSIVMINVGGGRYYALLPTNNNTMDKYFQVKNLHSTIFQYSNALIELIQAYPLADICSKISQTIKSFCDDISHDMNTKILDAVRIAFKYADRIPLRSESSINVNSHFEVVIRMLGERVTSESLGNIVIDPNVRTIVPWNINSSKGACNEQTVAGQDTPDSRIINIGKSHVAINFHYETFTIKDMFDVYYTGEKIFSSECVSTAGERVAAIQLNADETYLLVNVTPNCDGSTGTQWYYAIECPSNNLQCDEIHCYCGLKQNASRQIKEPTMDGCGDQHVRWNYGSIHWLENYYNFTSVCNEHDRCYGTCNTNRLTCDNAFCSGVMQSCAINWNHSLEVNMCTYWAQKFCSYMADYGSGLFANVQNEVCSCDGTSPITTSATTTSATTTTTTTTTTTATTTTATTTSATTTTTTTTTTATTTTATTTSVTNGSSSTTSPMTTTAFVPVDPKCNGATCSNFTKCSLINPNCVCFSLSRGSGICGDGNVSCAKVPPCNTDTLTCNDPQSVCVVNSCCNKPVCFPLSSTGSSVCPTNSSDW